MIDFEELPLVITPWSYVGYLTYKRTYSRKLDDSLGTDSPTEDFEDTVLRIINACDYQLKCGFTKDEEYRLAGYLLGLKALPAGRFMWQLGTETVSKLGLSSLQNCAATPVDHPIRPFTWCMDMLALGSGVGYNIQRKHVNKLPEVREWFFSPERVDDAGADFIVPDSREGWVRLLGKTLKAAFLSQTPDKGSFTFDTRVVRGKGSPIRGFGGVASGPEDLCWGIGEISRILMRRRGRKIRPIDALDIMNIIGHIIVAGNVRRSAQIAIGDPDDVEFLLAKRWDMGHIPKWRAMSNNSVACNSIHDLHDYFWDGYEGKGEPYGLINLELARSCGRLGETEYPDPNVEAFNPCAEQSLDAYETCCLNTNFLPNIKSYEELLDIIELFYRINKHSLLLRSHHPETNDVVHKNMRMGMSMAGYLQATEEQRAWLPPAYLHLRAFDKQYSKKHHMPESIKLTTMKPDGTAALLLGVTPGAHPGYSEFMFRRITIASDHQLVDICRKHGYPIEYKKELDGSEDYGSVIVTFPYSYPKGTKLAKDMTALDQLKVIRRLQTEWSDNSVSCTIYYKKEEIPEIRRYLERYYKDNYKTLSFLLHSDHGFQQAPYEEVTEEQYNDLISKCTKITSTDAIHVAFEGTDECASGACPIK